MFWVISVYFNLRNILPKSGTFLPGHPVYAYSFCGGWGVVDNDVDRVRVSYKVLAFVPDGYLLKLNSSASF